ncbi:hypothetical protein [Marinimicrobium locisalis]|uniref:hypothetical protein n=1 Tax=Marinimicrobium locisalis TaxID=546022 RepID=UPI003221D43A
MISSIYLNSPVVFQNAMISLYGVKTYADRFMGPLPDTYKKLKHAFSPPDKSSFELQDQRLKQLLKHCQSNVPYYKGILADVDVELINRKNIHNYFPLLTKKDVVNNVKSLVPGPGSCYYPEVKISTSGTSGTPLTIYATKESRRVNYAFFNNFLESLGASYRAKSTILAGRKIYKRGSRKVDRYDYFNRTQYLSVYDISPDTISKYIEALNRWQPEYIDSHPSALFELQYLAMKKGLKLNFSPKFIVTSSESLTATIRNKVESFFCSKIYDHYGCAEMCISAFNSDDKYYNDPTYSIIELIDKGNDLYSVVVTGLVNFGMPLIRYEIGDLVHCSDLRDPYTFDSVDGRLDDIIVTPEGRLVGRLSPVFKGIPGLELAQVVQESKYTLVVNAVLREEERDKFDESLIISKLKSSTSESMSVRVNYVADIEKNANGKFKSVVNLVKEL